VRRLRWFILLAVIAAVSGSVWFLVYFPGRQASIALTLASGIGIERLQARVDAVEEMAVRREGFPEEERVFVSDLYNCFAKGAGLIWTLRQSAELMRHYLDRSGEMLEVEPRVFLGSRPIKRTMAELRDRLMADIRAGRPVRHAYESEEFYMGDPEFFESFVALYEGTITLHPTLLPDGSIELRWSASMPWEWPTYEEIVEKYGDPNGQAFPIPNARSLMFGGEHALKIDDGLGAYLVELGLAKPFLVRSGWEGLTVLPADD